MFTHILHCRLGLIEWMEDVVPLKELLSVERTEPETERNRNAFREYTRKYSNSLIYVENYSKFSAKDCQTWFTGIVRKLPANLLR